MTKEELKKLKETIAYFGHWYDVIGEERVLILEKSIEYITDLEKQIEELKEKHKQDELCLIISNSSARAELQDQIEKMKCCNNCKHSRKEYEHCITDKHEKWELAE